MLTAILVAISLTQAMLLAYCVAILRDVEQRMANLQLDVDEVHALLCQLAMADVDDVTWGDTDGAYQFEAHERNGVGHG